MFKVLDLGSDKVVAVEVDGKLTHADYAETLIPKLDAVVKNHGQARLFLDLKNFGGWDWKAAWDDFKTGIQHRKDIEKIALVGDHAWQEWASKIFGLVMNGELKYFKHDDIEAAKQWILE